MWTLVIVGYAVTKQRRAIGDSFLGVVRAALQWKLVVLYGVTVLYGGAAVCLLNQADLWHQAALKQRCSGSSERAWC